MIWERFGRFMCISVLVSDSFTTNTREKSPVYNKSDSLSTRAKKLQIVKEGTKEKPKRIQIKELNASVDENTNHDVQFLIQVIILRCFALNLR